MTEIVVFGGSGFVGSALVAALDPEQVRAVTSPRLRTSARSADQLLAAAAAEGDLVAELAERLRGAAVVVNAAGDPDASSLDEDGLFGANALLPAVLLLAARRAGVRRFVHVSSAVVQNDKPVLDASEDLRPFSPYSTSKVRGEEVVRHLAGEGGVEVTRYRPPSVHAPGRRVTRMIARIAASPAASVAAPGTQPTPQALLPNVAAAIAFLATTELPVSAVVHHPSEGVTVAGLMEDLGGRPPRRIPPFLARFLVLLAKLLGRVHRPTAANARRVELLWLGQRQEPSWLEEAGWRPPVGREAWRALAVREDA